MTPQSIDTHLDAERVQLAIIRSFSPEKKLQLMSQQLMLLGLPLRPSDQLDTYITLLYGNTYSKQLRRYLAKYPETRLEARDLARTLAQLKQLFEQRHIRFAIAGRAACIFYGLPSSFNDLEIVCDSQKVFRFGTGWFRHQSWYFDVARLFRVQINFDPASVQDAYEGHRTLAGIPVVSPERIIQHMMQAYLRTDARDDSMLHDLLGMLKVQSGHLNVALLRETAGDLMQIEQLLLKAGILHE